MRGFASTTSSPCSFRLIDKADTRQHVQPYAGYAAFHDLPRGPSASQLLRAYTCVLVTTQLSSLQKAQFRSVDMLSGCACIHVPSSNGGPGLASPVKMGAMPSWGRTLRAGQHMQSSPPGPVSTGARAPLQEHPVGGCSGSPRQANLKCSNWRLRTARNTRPAHTARRWRP